MQEKSIIVVGNGGSLKNKSLGKKIDEFDSIIRFNNWHTKGYENIAGSRTDIWVSGCPSKGLYRLIRNLDNDGYDMKSILNYIKDVKELWFFTFPKVWISKSQEWKHSNSILDKYNLESKPIRKINKEFSALTERELKSHPSTGFQVIFALTQIYNKIYITGFDFWGHLESSNYEHYFTDVKIDMPTKLPAHIPPNEYRYVKKLIEDKKIILLNNDSKITPSIPILEFINYTCDKCKKTSNLYPWQVNECIYCDG